MIIKSISTKSAGNLISYIFREKPLKPRSFSRFKEQLKDKAEKDLPVYVAGRLLSKSDVRNLIAELGDKQLDAAIKDYKGTRDDFIKELLMAKGSLSDFYRQANPFVITKNLRSAKTVEGYIREFEQSNERRIYKSRDMSETQHIILSWHEADAAKLTDAKLKAMAQEFIRLHGEDKLYCATAHHDKGHTHIHLAISGTRLDGMSARVSKTDFERIKKDMTLFQERHFPELSNSLPGHGKKSRTGENKIERPERNNVRSPLLQYLDETYGKATSLSNFLAQLKENNIEPYERGGRMTGVVADGYKFRFSRLGYDMERLQELDARKARSDASLKELGSIRGRGKEVQKSKENISELTGTLQELAEIRNAAVEREKSSTNENEIGNNNGENERPDQMENNETEETDFTDTLNTSEHEEDGADSENEQ